MQFKQISISEWRQFRDIKIDLHKRLTILTGPNGSGKSTVLSLLALSMSNVHHEPFMATPVNDRKSGRSGFTFSTLFSRLNPFRRHSSNFGDESVIIGTIEYTSGERGHLITVDRDKLQYQVTIQNLQNVVGFKIDSHRALPRYQPVAALPVSGIKPSDAFTYFAQSQSSYQRGELLQRNGRKVTNPIAPLKETLIGFAAFGADNAYMKAVPELVGLFDDFQGILRRVLPKEIGFIRLEVRSPEIVIVSRTGDFPIDSASGGLMAIIQTVWQVFLFTQANGNESVVLIDEPENHLHPSLQRDFLSNLVEAFPSIQFVVATHSPFIISSVKESTTYALRYSQLSRSSADSDSSSLENQNSAVTAFQVDMWSKAGSAARILDEILGVSVTIPVWAEKELETISSRFERAPLSKASINQLREDLKRAGLSEYFPEAVGKLNDD
jgi:energy-coupling factor transporter ATP-binding protein EcfA2